MKSIRIRQQTIRMRRVNTDLPYGVRADATIFQRYGQAKLVEIVTHLGIIGDDVFAPPGVAVVTPVYRMGDGQVFCLCPMKDGGENWLTILYADVFGVEVPENIEPERIYKGLPGFQRTNPVTGGEK